MPGLAAASCRDAPGGFADGDRSADILRIVEVREPECLMALPELAEIDEPEEFERLAFAWLEQNEAAIATEIAARHDAELVSWRYEADFADNTTFGATIVVIGTRR